ncbi:ThuA-like domain-containing protein [Rhizoctonia solani]|nr:ThuA-like domain-containing protein [Rhizoctonia solani]
MANLIAKVTPRVLIYSATAGYRHDSIPAATAALQQLGQQHGIAFDATEDRAQFNDNNLANYDAVLFLSNSEEVLDDGGKQAFQTYLNKGGNYIGIHAASACLYDTPFYQNEVGALFDYHPELQPVTFLVLDKDHPSTTMLPDRWTFTEEVYNFRSDPRSVGAKILLSVDASSYTDTHIQTYNQGSPHPIAWYQERGAGAAHSSTAGRSFYTSLGHLTSTWADQTFLAHVLGGIQWTLASNTSRAINPSGQVAAVP